MRNPEIVNQRSAIQPHHMFDPQMKVCCAQTVTGRCVHMVRDFTILCVDFAKAMFFLGAVQTWPVTSWCSENKVGFVDNWQTFWVRPRLIRRDGIHQTLDTTALMSRNLTTFVREPKLTIQSWDQTLAAVLHTSLCIHLSSYISQPHKACDCPPTPQFKWNIQEGNRKTY